MTKYESYPRAIVIAIYQQQEQYSLSTISFKFYSTKMKTSFTFSFVVHSKVGNHRLSLESVNKKITSCEQTSSSSFLTSFKS